jgi:hypothetical protein
MPTLFGEAPSIQIESGVTNPPNPSDRTRPSVTVSDCVSEPVPLAVVNGTPASTHGDVAVRAKIASVVSENSGDAFIFEDPH